jgi:hypothetical protein
MISSTIKLLSAAVNVSVLLATPALAATVHKGKAFEIGVAGPQLVLTDTDSCSSLVFRMALAFFTVILDAGRRELLAAARGS